MRSQHIRALTGVRFFAALWVVLYHSTRYNQDLVIAQHPTLHHLAYPLTSAGVRGVDLFFMLSGFVLALNYMDLGQRFRIRPALRFLWLRLARIWPLYMLVLLAAAALRVVRHDLWHSAGTATLTWPNLLRQTFMVQKWFPPAKGPDSWVGPAWSLSAEWLAYLVFPLVVLLVARAHRRLPPWALLVLAATTMMPLLVAISINHSMSGHVWILRILCEFVTGMLLCAAASRLRLSPRGRRAAGVGALLSVAAIVAWLYGVSALDAPVWWGMCVVVLFVPLVFFLGTGAGPLHNLLSTRALVLGGGLSYALYLVHSPMLYMFRDVTRFTVLHLEPVPRYYAELAFIPVIVLTAWFLYRFFEEPVRKLMRRALGPARPRPDGPEGPPDPSGQLDRSIARRPTNSPSSATTPAPRNP